MGKRSYKNGRNLTLQTLPHFEIDAKSLFVDCIEYSMTNLKMFVYL